MEEKAVEDEGEEGADSSADSTTSGTDTADDNAEGSLGEDESSPNKAQADINESFDDLLSRFSAKHPIPAKSKHSRRKSAKDTKAQ